MPQPAKTLRVWILTQIIVEDAKTTDSSFPLDVLRQMVIASGRVGQEGTLKYMKAMLDFYQNSYRMMAPTANPFEFMSRPRRRPRIPTGRRQRWQSCRRPGGQGHARQARARAPTPRRS